MSETKHSDTIITNERTLRRRSWIDRAVAGVKGKAVSGEEGLEARESGSKPKMYIVSSNRPR
jgi:hypothetical protein